MLSTVISKGIEECSSRSAQDECNLRNRALTLLHGRLNGTSVCRVHEIEQDVDSKRAWWTTFAQQARQPSQNRSTPYLTVYETALIVGHRAMQLASGSEPLIKVLPDDNYLTIAERELQDNVLPVRLRRALSDGHKTEYVEVQSLRQCYELARAV